MHNQIYTGAVFTRWTIIGPPAGYNSKVLCRCECSAERSVLVANLIAGRSKSCGCLNKELVTERSRRRETTHGHAGGGQSPTYQTWRGMIQRCTNPNYSGWEYYGGRGIGVCERWCEFANFIADMGERPDGLTLDRIDSDGNYEPANCRWATPAQQTANRRPRSSKRTVLLAVLFALSLPAASAAAHPQAPTISQARRLLLDQNAPRRSERVTGCDRFERTVKCRLTLIFTGVGEPGGSVDYIEVVGWHGRLLVSWERR